MDSTYHDRWPTVTINSLRASSIGTTIATRARFTVRSKMAMSYTGHRPSEEPGLRESVTDGYIHMTWSHGLDFYLRFVVIRSIHG